MGVPNESELTLTVSEKFVPRKIGVVTVTFGSGDVLPDFFKSLDQQTFRNFMLISVDNSSTDSTVDQLHANEGCEYVLLVNNDVVFGPELLQQLLDGLSEHHCQMTTPIMYYYDCPDVIWAAGGYFQPWLGYRCLHIGEGEQDIGQYSEPRLVEHTPTCCVLIKREVFAKVGLMDERYFVYHDDTDFMLRALKAGQRLYCLPQSKLLHKVSSLAGTDSVFQVRYGTRNRAFMLVKFLGRLLS